MADTGPDEKAGPRNAEEPLQEEGARAELSAEEAASDDEVLPSEPSEALTQLGRALAVLQRENQQLRDRWMRSVADGENFRKRARRDLQDAVLNAEDRVLRALLPTTDNLQRALAHAESSEEEVSRGLVEGVRMVHKQFVQALEALGVTPFESVGEPFDPELHEAIQQVHSEHPPSSVAFELHQGYRRDSRLVRPAMVAVSKGPPPPAEDPGEGQQTDEGATSLQREAEEQ